MAENDGFNVLVSTETGGCSSDLRENDGSGGLDSSSCEVSEQLVGYLAVPEPWL